MDNVLLTEGLSKTYAADGIDVEAVRKVDLAVAPGEFVSIMGPSGCGKSTLLHMLGDRHRMLEHHPVFQPAGHAVHFVAEPSQLCCMTQFEPAIEIAATETTES